MHEQFKKDIVDLVQSNLPGFEVNGVFDPSYSGLISTLTFNISLEVAVTSGPREILDKIETAFKKSGQGYIDEMGDMSRSHSEEMAKLEKYKVFYEMYSRANGGVQGYE